MSDDGYGSMDVIKVDACNCFVNNGLRKFSILPETIVYDEILGL